MKRIRLAACILFPLLVACAPQDDGEEQPAMEEDNGGATVAEPAGGPEEQAIAQLNEMCPENWCADEYQYEFLSIACEGEECVLQFRAEHSGEEIEDSIRFDYDEPLIDEFGDLEPSYFERVTDALLDEWEPAQAEGD